VLFHNGTQTGARSVLLLYPDAGLVVAVLSNLTNTPQLIEGTAMGIAEPFLRAAMPNESYPGDLASAGSYDYRVGSGVQSATGTLQLVAVGDHLEGWMTTTPGAKLDRLPIPFLFAGGGEAGGAVVAPEGLLLLRLRDTATRPAASITFHSGLKSTRIEVSLERKSS
jgi:hypothetical protein